jgi:hypothetical protein
VENILDYGDNSYFYYYCSLALNAEAYFYELFYFAGIPLLCLTVSNVGKELAFPSFYTLSLCSQLSTSLNSVLVSHIMFIKPMSVMPLL